VSKHGERFKISKILIPCMHTSKEGNNVKRGGQEEQSAKVDIVTDGILCLSMRATI